jgi:ubiquitin carboxyl-terminal hydrolase 9/24
MHQPQYVEKLEKILRFLIKEKSLTLKDLDKIWESQLNKHEAIEKNVHDLLSKLAWDFTPEQLDHLFSCFEVFVLFYFYKRLILIFLKLFLE